MIQKGELLSDLLFPEDQGNCRPQTGVIIWILKGAKNVLAHFIMQFALGLEFTELSGTKPFQLIRAKENIA